MNGSRRAAEAAVRGLRSEPGLAYHRLPRAVFESARVHTTDGSRMHRTLGNLVPEYSLSTLRGDLYGGLTAAVVALPLALAFGVASGAGPVAGLYGAVLVGFFAAVFGGTPSQVSGPTGPMTVVMALVLTRFAHEPAVAFTVVMLGGLFQIAFGLLRLGRFVNLVPYPVISGFMSGIGCIIIILQLGPLLGHANPGGGTLGALHAVPGFLQAIELHALLLGLLSLAIVFLVPARVSRLLPSPLLALLAGTALAVGWLHEAPVIGAIPTGLPALQIPTLSLEDFPVIVRSALVLAFLGSIDSLLTALIADSMTRSQHRSDRELIGQGLGNLAAGLCGAIPGAGATMRTVINVRAGGRTRLSGALHALVLLAVVLGFGSFAAHIPHAVLAGILIKVGVDIIDWKYLRRLLNAPRAGVVIMAVVLALTVLVDLVTAVAVGVVMASLLFVKRMADAQMSSMKLVRSAFEMGELGTQETAILERAQGRILLFHIDGPISFGSARDIVRALTSSGLPDALVIDLSDVPFVDSSASFALEEVIRRAHEAGDFLLLGGPGPRVRATLARLGVLDLLPGDRVADTRLEALSRAESLLGGS